MDVKVFINGVDLWMAAGQHDFSGLLLVNKEYNGIPFPEEQKILNVGKNTIKIEYQPTGSYASLKLDLTASGYTEPILKVQVGGLETKDVKAGVIEREFDL